MNESKYFARGKVQELKAELGLKKKDSKKLVGVLKKIIANMTMGNDMSSLFKDVLDCMSMESLEIKKMILLYLVSYARKEPELTLMALSFLVRDAQDPNPLFRALAIKTIGNLPIDTVSEKFCPIVKKGLTDKDPYVVRTTVLAISKLYFSRPDIVQSEGLLSSLESLLDHDNASVVANVVAVLIDISSKAQEFDLVIDYGIANKLLSVIEECSEWGQIHLLEAVSYYVPAESHDAEIVAERVIPRLQHANSAIVLTAVRVILYLSNYVASEEKLTLFYKKLGPPLVTLLNGPPEIQFVALKNITLILQSHSTFLRDDIKVFFCKYNDPIYVKLAKLDILCRLVSEDNIHLVLPELKEYANEVDIDFVRKTVRSVGLCAIKIEGASDKCVQALVELFQTRVSYVVQEAVVVIKDIFRRYPNKYESIISALCENLDELNEPEAKASMIWIIGHYADRIDNAGDLLAGFLEAYKEDTPVVQLCLLTAIVKLFIRRPAVGQALVPKVLQFATDDVDNPDLRDRGFIYWRLLSTNPLAAKAIVFSERPPISNDAESLDPVLLNELLLNLSTLASLYHKSPGIIVGGLKPRRLIKSAAFVDKLAAKQKSNENWNHIEQYSPETQEETYMGEDETVQHQPMPSHYADLLDTRDDDIPDFPITSDGLQSAGGESPWVDSDYGSFDISKASSVGYRNSTNVAAGYAPSNTGLPLNNPPPSYPQSNGDLPLGRSIQPSPHNPFSSNPFRQPLESSQIPSRPSLSVITNYSSNTKGSIAPMSPQRQAIVSSSNVMLDPFSKTSGMTTLLSRSDTTAVSPQLVSTNNTSNHVGYSRQDVGIPSVAKEFLSLTLESGLVLEKSLFLGTAEGRGLEIYGTFAQRQSVTFVDMTFSNRSLQPMTDFGILFNTNSFSLCPVQPLRLPDEPLMPNQQQHVSLPLKLEGIPKTSSPINNLQVAIKTNAGIVYFQTLVPLHVLFNMNGQVTPERWLRLWSTDIPQSQEFGIKLDGLRFPSLGNIKSRLSANLVFIVADRVVDQTLVIYVSVNAGQDHLFLSELRFDMSFTTCSIATKSKTSVPLVPIYHEALERILRQS